MQRSGGQFWDDHVDAVGQTLSFLMAGTLFVSSMAAVLVATTDLRRDSQGADQAIQDHQAASLRDSFVSSSGKGWDGSPDDLGKLGLASASGGLDIKKMKALAGHGYNGSLHDGVIDYQEAKTLLGLDAQQQFRLKVEPGTAAINSLGGLRTMYIANFDTPPTHEDLICTAAGADCEESNLFSSQASPATITENSELLQLGLDYDGKINLEYSQMPVGCTSGGIQGVPVSNCVESFEGDVYMDWDELLLEMVPKNIHEYNVVLIGTDVDHLSLEQPEVAESIRDWVLAGGHLVVMGSEYHSTGWMDALWGGIQDTEYHPSTGNDLDHATLRVPNRLDPTIYLGRSLPFTPETYASYQHVLFALPDRHESKLAISDADALGAGGMAWTGYQTRPVVYLDEYIPVPCKTSLHTGTCTPSPRLHDGVTELPSDEINGDSFKILENLIFNLHYQDYFVDFGPEPPSDLEVGRSRSVSHVEGASFVSVTVDVQVWGP